MTPTRQDLLNALGQIQNHPANINQDIMTITGCGMTDDEVRQHIERNMSHIIRWNMEQANKPPKKNCKRK